MKKLTIGIIGLGYVGLPLAIEFSKKNNVIGFDTNKKRINELKNFLDSTNELTELELKSAKNLTYTYKSNKIKSCEIYIITIPTPINKNKKPDLKLLLQASKTVGLFLNKNNLVIYESTVFPGATEEICVPILEKYSNLKFNKDFFCGYSPERVNPGDKNFKLTKIKKVTSGSTPEIAIKIDNLYQSIIKAGTYLAPSIMVAEAAKVIENTQRDINIGLVNEFAIIFNKLNINTNEVLKAAGTKWNFLPFKPGLVGGHCIGVDPYYLAYKAKKIGINPKLIIAGRETNDRMANYIIQFVIKAMRMKSIEIINSNVLIMGMTFKENCQDIRNSKVVDLFNGFKKRKMNVDIYDPIANKKDVFNTYNLKLINKPIKKKYDLVLIAVAHDQFKTMSTKYLFNLCKKNNVIYDLKNIFPEIRQFAKL